MKASAASGEPEVVVFLESSAGTRAETLNGALRLALLHAVPEILEAIRSAT